MDIILTFHIIIIIYQSFNLKIFWKIYNMFFFQICYLNNFQTLCSIYNKLNEVFCELYICFKMLMLKIIYF
jgi:hypothetical protein